MSDDRFLVLFEQAPAPIVITDDQGRYLDANPAACALFGLSREELLTRSVADLTTPTPGGAQLAFADYRRSDAAHGEFEFIRADGERRVTLWSATRTSSGEHVCVLHDATGWEKTYRELQEQKQRAQAYLDVAGVILLGLDTSFRITLLNPHGCEVLGVSDCEEVVGRSWLDFLPEDERGRVRDLFTQILRDGAVQHQWVEARLLTAAGATRTVLWHNALLRDADGEVVGTLSSGEDITERLALEAQLAQTDRLRSMGQLAAGVAHEINNPLSYVLYNLDSLKEDLSVLLGALEQVGSSLESGASPAELQEVWSLLAADLDELAFDDLAERFQDAIEGSQRIREITRGLGGFSRVEDEELVPVSLIKVAEAAMALATHEVKYRARLVPELRRVPPVLASEGRLSQVVLNLLLNAAHAIEEGDVEHNAITVRTWLEGDLACLEVEDTGSGVAPDVQERVFEPFFTTKPAGVGTGLGLSISRSIVQSYGGTIELTSAPGRGTRVRVRLPVGRVAATRSVEGGGSEVERALTGRVLVVDDEASMRRIVRRILRDCVVVEAGDGEQARRLLSEDSAFDLVLCDVMMPEVAGYQLHEWLVTAHPELATRFVFLTGGAFTPVAGAYLASVDVPRIQKPFTGPELRQAVADQLASSRRGGEEG